MINVSDHHTRVKANAQSSSAAPAPVMGCLLGSQSGRVVDISNSFEIEYKMENGSVVINEAFLSRKQEQCARGGGGGRPAQQRPRLQQRAGDRSRCL
jgi:COP9 signalosome complex subunit 6